MFLVFLALAVVFTGALAFGSDSIRFMTLQKRVKVLAEECAEAAAMCLDAEESRVSGRICIDIEKGRQAAEQLLSRAEYLSAFGDAELKVSISPFGSSGVLAEVCWTGKDPGVFGPLIKNSAARTAAYEWVSIAAGNE